MRRTDAHSKSLPVPVPSELDGAGALVHCSVWVVLAGKESRLRVQGKYNTLRAGCCCCFQILGLHICSPASQSVRVFLWLCLPVRLNTCLSLPNNGLRLSFLRFIALSHSLSLSLSLSNITPSVVVYFSYYYEISPTSTSMSPRLALHSSYSSPARAHSSSARPPGPIKNLWSRCNAGRAGIMKYLGPWTFNCF